MRRSRVLALGVLGMLALGACSTSKFKTYDGPEVTQVVVDKGERAMVLLHHDTVLRAYRIELGFAPEGHKQVEGDGRTPEGDYLVNRRNPNSSFHLSLGISYPDTEDVMRARSAGLSPGGDIFIHGQKQKRSFFSPGRDWTAGCIAVRNRDIEEIYAMVQTGTPITLRP